MDLQSTVVFHVICESVCCHIQPLCGKWNHSTWLVILCSVSWDEKLSLVFMRCVYNVW